MTSLAQLVRTGVVLHRMDQLLFSLPLSGGRGLPFPGQPHSRPVLLDKAAFFDIMNIEGRCYRRSALANQNRCSMLTARATGQSARFWG